MLAVIVAKYRLLQNYSNDTVYNRVILATFFLHFALLKIDVASKILEPTTCRNKRVI